MGRNTRRRNTSDVPVHEQADFNVGQQEGFNAEAGVGVTEATAYRRWELDTVAPYCTGSVLEVGSGAGHFSKQLVKLGLRRLVLSDTAPDCLSTLRATYGGEPGVEVVDLALPGTVDIEPVDAIVAMNVIEHIEDDAAAVRDLAAALTPGGVMIHWVPAYMALYGDFDRKIGHYRRYTPAMMRTVVEQAGLRVETLRPINFLGGIGWWLAVHRGGVQQPRKQLVWIFDKIAIPLTRAAERFIRPPFGQSVLCIARKPA
ncbi:MAG: class I SAM-dependent methyltransferase [Mycobacteriales bacterium]|nr:MAG: methyltransferase [Pseudonocardiales bacterium]